MFVCLFLVFFGGGTQIISHKPIPSSFLQPCHLFAAIDRRKAEEKEVTWAKETEVLVVTCCLIGIPVGLAGFCQESAPFPASVDNLLLSYKYQNFCG